MSSLEPQNSISFNWKNQSVFILVMIGVTLSMKDFLVFPVMVAEHGGGAYILLYACFLMLLGLPLLISELLIGRQLKRPFFSKLSSSFQCSKHWQWLISLSILASICVLSIYNVIASWSLSFVFKTAVGLFDQSSEHAINTLLSDFQIDPERMMLWHTLFILLLLVLAAQGIRLGVQKALTIFLPIMLVLLVIGLVYSIIYGDYLNSVEHLLNADFSKINLSVVLIAMQQAFYTLSIGLGIFLVFGSKLPQNISIVYSGVIVIVIDLLFSILTALAISSFVFSAEAIPKLNDELAFAVLPFIFSNLPFGQFFGTLFYVLLTLAAVTTAIALLEVLVRFLKEKFRLSRLKASVYASLVTWFIGVMAIFSYTIWQDSGFTVELTISNNAFRIVNEAGFQDVVIYMSSLLIQPFVAFLMIIFVAWKIDKKDLATWLSIENSKIFETIYFTIRYITPTLIFIVWLTTIGAVQYA